MTSVLAHAARIAARIFIVFSLFVSKKRECSGQRTTVAMRVLAASAIRTNVDY